MVIPPGDMDWSVSWLLMLFESLSYFTAMMAGHVSGIFKHLRTPRIWNFFGPVVPLGSFRYLVLSKSLVVSGHIRSCRSWPCESSPQEKRAWEIWEPQGSLYWTMLNHMNLVIFASLGCIGATTAAKWSQDEPPQLSRLVVLPDGRHDAGRPYLPLDAHIMCGHERTTFCNVHCFTLFKLV